MLDLFIYGLLSIDENFLGFSLNNIYLSQNRSNKLREKVDLLSFMNWQKFLLSSLSLISLAASASPDKLIEQAVNNSISGILPLGSSWEIKTPNFAKENLIKANQIQVSFPSGIKSDRMVAQVKIKNLNEEILIAVPVQIHSLFKI